MLKRNIPKFFAFVITLGTVSVIFSACGIVSSNNARRGGNVSNDEKRTSSEYQAPKILATIKSDEIRESSGLANSPCQPEILWTHNDSGDNAFIFALDKTGKKLATFKVAGAKNNDWEDMAIRQTEAGECFLYIGDIGNNERLKSEMTVYMVKEPEVTGATASSKKNPLATAPAQAIRFEYPDSRHDAETLLVHPQSGDLYVLTKHISDAAGVYRLRAVYDSNKTNRLEKIAALTVPAIPNGLLTGGAISPDGTRLALCDYFSAYELVLPAGAQNFDEIWRQKPQKIETGARPQGETIAYSADGSALFATSERKDSPLIFIGRK